MNDNTILRIKVPAHLYESVKEQLTLTEAKKSGHNYGAGMEVVKEKKLPIKGKKQEEKEPVAEKEIKDEAKIEEAPMQSADKVNAVDKIEALINDTTTVAFLNKAKNVVTTTKDVAKLLLALKDKMASKEGEAFKKASDVNPGLNRADQGLKMTAGVKEEKKEEKDEE